MVVRVFGLSGQRCVYLAAMTDRVTIKDTGERPHPKVTEIKEAIMSCACGIEVDECAKHYAFEVFQMQKAGGYLRTMSIQIKNLAAYRRREVPRVRPKGS